LFGFKNGEKAKNAFGGAEQELLTLHANISDTIYSRVVKVDQKVACGNTFKMV